MTTKQLSPLQRKRMYDFDTTALLFDGNDKMEIIVIFTIQMVQIKGIQENKYRNLPRRHLL